MTATYSDEITNVISNLRSNIYNSEEFVRKFTEYMNRNGICNVGFGYDPTGGINIYNTVHTAQIQRAALSTTIPYHGSALQTTFLHMSMKPYV